jgi:ABC-type nitrate/sulfonate/bicarbonate transport system substrate-binding protein
MSLEYVRVGGSTRIVAALLGGSAPIIHAGEPAVQRGADDVIISAFCNAAQHRLIVRPEIKDVKDLKDKPVGVTKPSARPRTTFCVLHYKNTAWTRTKTCRLCRRAANPRAWPR